MQVIIKGEGNLSCCGNEIITKPSPASIIYYLSLTQQKMTASLPLNITPKIAYEWAGILTSQSKKQSFSGQIDQKIPAEKFSTV